MTESDALVMLWRATRRPLNWWAWRRLHRQDQAELRYALIRQLQIVDSEILPAFWWRHTHRELLELKAASGHGD